MIKKSEEGTDFNKAVGLKSKVLELIQSCSEVHNYLKVAVDDIQAISALRNDAVADNAKIKREADAINKALEESKRAFEAEKKAQEEWRVNDRKHISEIHIATGKDREDAAKIKFDIEKREADLSKREEEFESKRRDLEARHAKIAELAGA